MTTTLAATTERSEPRGHGLAALVRMRLYAFARSGRIAAPLILGIIVIGTLYGGGAVAAGEGYGLSAFVLVPVLAWQTKLLLDTEPDVARRLAVVTVGRRREIAAGLIAAALVAVTVVCLAIVLPWLFGGIKTHDDHGPPFIDGLTLGVWAHLLAIGPAAALGALSSRVVTRSAGHGAMTLIGGWIALVVIGLPRSPVRWLGPPLLADSNAAHQVIRTPVVLGLTGWMLAWTATAVVAYVMMRRTRA